MKLKNRFIAIALAVLLCFVSVFLQSSSVSAVYLNTSMAYMKYDRHGDHVLTYSLSNLSKATASNSNVSTHGVIDSDGRLIDNTKNGIVKIVNSTGAYGTGFVIDDHKILTAAHVVSDTENTESNAPDCGAYVTRIYLYNSNGGIAKTMTPANVTGVHIPKQFIDVGGAEYDYAIITVSSDLSNYMCFNMGIMMDNFASKNTTLYTTGFSGDLGGEVRYTGQGTVLSIANSTFTNTIDCTGGNSGGPVYIGYSLNGKRYYSVVGIMVAEAYYIATDQNGTEYKEYTHNIAVRTTPNLLHFCFNNTNL